MVETLTFYQRAIPIDSIESGRDRTSPQTAVSGLVGETTGDVERVSTDPEEDRLTAHCRGDGAERMARELEELASAASVETIPIVDSRPSTKRDGYYGAELVSASPSARQATQSYDVEIRLRSGGTRETHWRSAEATPSTISHDFGTTDEAHLAIPAAATKVRWANREDGTTAEVGSALATRASEFGAVDVYDADAAPVDQPTLIYELDYDEEGRTDPVVWDEDVDASKTNADGSRNWMHVYATDHEFEGVPLLDNGLLRVRFLEPSGTIEAETWDDGTSSWSSTSLGDPGDWTLRDADITRIGLAEVVVYLDLLDPVAGETFALEGLFQRGAEDVVFSVPENETGPIPADVQTWLGPIASERSLTATPRTGLLSRSEVQ